MMHNRDYVNLTINNELYHFGRKGMKWGKHLFGEEARAYKQERAQKQIFKSGSVSKAESNATRAFGTKVLSNVYKNVLVNGAAGAASTIGILAGVSVLPAAAMVASSAYGTYTIGKTIVQTGKHLSNMKSLRNAEVPEKYNDVYRDK